MDQVKQREEHLRRARWLCNSFVATGIFFTTKGTAEANRDKIQSLEDLRVYPPSQVLDRLKLSNVGAYISADEANPHGQSAISDLGDGKHVKKLLKSPEKGGVILGNWKNDKGEYMVSWLIGGDDKGLKQVTDIVMRRKPQMSFAWGTQFIKDPEGKVTSLRVVPHHVAVLGHKGHEPQYPECRIMEIKPLMPSMNQTFPQLKKMIREAETRQMDEEFSDFIREAAEKTLVTLEAETKRIAPEEWEKMRQSVDYFVKDIPETGTVAPSAETAPSGEEAAAAAPKAEEEEAGSPPVPVVAEEKSAGAVALPATKTQNINLPAATWSPPAPPKGIISLPPGFSESYFSFPLPQAPSIEQPHLLPAVCASSKTFASATESNSKMSAPPATNAPGPSADQAKPMDAESTAPGQQQQQQQKGMSLQEIESAIEDYNKKYTSGEYKKPARPDADGKVPDDPDSHVHQMHWTNYTALRALYNEEKYKAKDEEHKKLVEEVERIKQENESYKKAGVMITKANAFRDQYLRNNPNYKPELHDKFVNRAGSMAPDMLNDVEAYLDMVMCSASDFANQAGQSPSNKRGRDGDDSSSAGAPAAKRQLSVDPNQFRGFGETMDRLFPTSSGSGGSSSSSSSSSRAAEKAEDKPLFDINTFVPDRISDDAYNYHKTRMLN